MAFTWMVPATVTAAPVPVPAMVFRMGSGPIAEEASTTSICTLVALPMIGNMPIGLRSSQRRGRRNQNFHGLFVFVVMANGLPQMVLVSVALALPFNTCEGGAFS